MTDQRSPLPDIAALNDEHTMLTEFLDYYRAVLLRKVEGLDEQQVRITVAASSIDLLGLVRHMSEVERYWFRDVFTDEVDTPLYWDADDMDADWHHTPDDTMAEALRQWHEEVAIARHVIAGCTNVDTISATETERRGRISLRWIMVHMIEEYARHCGHADFIREAIDGTVED